MVATITNLGEFMFEWYHLEVHTSQQSVLKVPIADYIKPNLDETGTWTGLFDKLNRLVYKLFKISNTHLNKKAWFSIKVHLQLQ